MAMNRFIILALTITLSAASLSGAQAADDAANLIDLKVLYAGHAGSERAKDFESFLTQHFREVATTSYSEFSPEQADDFDVVVFDWRGCLGLWTCDQADEKGQQNRDANECLIVRVCMTHHVDHLLQGQRHRFHDT